MDRNSIVYNDLTSANGGPLFARYIRIFPVEYKINICMRVELYECVGKLVYLLLGWEFESR